MVTEPDWVLLISTPHSQPESVQVSAPVKAALARLSLRLKVTSAGAVTEVQPVPSFCSTRAVKVCGSPVPLTGVAGSGSSGR